MSLDKDMPEKLIMPRQTYKDVTTFAKAKVRIWGDEFIVITDEIMSCDKRANVACRYSAKCPHTAIFRSTFTSLFLCIDMIPTLSLRTAELGL